MTISQLSNNCKAEIKQTDLAEKLGMSMQTLQNYKKLTEMIPELEELVDTGIVTPTTALAIMRNLSEEEQKQRPSALCRWSCYRRNTVLVPIIEYAFYWIFFI